MPSHNYSASKLQRSRFDAARLFRIACIRPPMLGARSRLKGAKP